MAGKSRKQEEPKQKMGLTKRQSDVLKFIREYNEDNGHSPSYQNIADNVGIRSKSHVLRVVSALAERGWIKKIPYRSRSLVVL